jgi:HrpA-like RNA helicase
MSKYDLLQDQRESLPTFEFKKDLIDAIREYSILVVIGETGTLSFHSISRDFFFANLIFFLGSGKTTQIPQYILEEIPELKRIGVTQPR